MQGIDPTWKDSNIPMERNRQARKALPETMFQVLSDLADLLSVCNLRGCLDSASEWQDIMREYIPDCPSSKMSDNAFRVQMGWLAFYCPSMVESRFMKDNGNSYEYFKVKRINLQKAKDEYEKNLAAL